jgi:hypothetical protein
MLFPPCGIAQLSQIESSFRTMTPHHPALVHPSNAALFHARAAGIAAALD